MWHNSYHESNIFGTWECQKNNSGACDDAPFNKPADILKNVAYLACRGYPLQCCIYTGAAIVYDACAAYCNACKKHIHTHQAPFCKRVASHTQISIEVHACSLQHVNADTPRFAILCSMVAYMICMAFETLFVFAGWLHIWIYMQTYKRCRCCRKCKHNRLLLWLASYWWFRIVLQTVAVAAAILWYAWHCTYSSISNSSMVVQMCTFAELENAKRKRTNKHNGFHNVQGLCETTQGFVQENTNTLGV